MDKKINIVYVTTSDFKIEENGVLLKECKMSDGAKVSDIFEFDIREIEIKEVLDVELSVIVEEEVKAAYRRIKVPCVVEHAGLIFEKYIRNSYPGGMTKPMWNVLGDEFIAETGSAGKSAIARAIVGYCDGTTIKTFVGERRGEISSAPRGRRKFYWDTVFIPEDPNGRVAGLTYAEIVDNPIYGIGYKVKELSQSTMAMLKFLEYRRKEGTPALWK